MRSSGLLYAIIFSSTFFSLWGQGRQLHFLELPSTTKTMALGGVTTSIVANDAALALETPALFGLEHKGQLSLSYHNYLSDTHIGSVFYANTVGRRGSWGVGAKYINYGSQEARNSRGEYLSSFSPQELSLQASYSYELTDRLRAGISLKGLVLRVAEYQTWGIATDLGINYFSEDKERSVGLSVVNIGRAITSPDGVPTMALPWDVRLGYSQKFAHAPIQIHLTAYNLRPRLQGEYVPELKLLGKLVRHLAFGVEFVPSNRFWIGLGYNPKIAQDYNEIRGGKLAGLSLGIGFDGAGYRVAVSSASYGGSFWSFMATFSTDFGFMNRF